MALVRINNPNLDKNETTLLTSAVAVAGTSLSVQSTKGFTNGDYIVIGKPAAELTESVRLDASGGIVSDTAFLSGAVKFAHTVDTPIIYTKWNQIRIYRATSKTGTYSLLTTISIEWDQAFSEYDDTTSLSTYYYKASLYNSSTTQESSKSDPVQATGYADNCLRKILDKIFQLGNDTEMQIVSEDEMIDFVNDAYRLAIDRTMKSDHKFYLKRAYVDIENSYNTGTVSVNDNATAVTGSSTSWDTGWTNKKIIFSTEGYPYQVSSVDSTTGLTLTRAYNGSGSNLSAVSYSIFQDEYTIYDESSGNALTDFRSIERVMDEDGNEVYERDLNRSEDGYYIKRESDNLKFCLNYTTATSGEAGRWEVYYIYQPAKMDSMGDTPELPAGSDSLLINYGIARLKERSGEEAKAQYYNARFEAELRNMTQRRSQRTNRRQGWRLDRNLVSSTDEDRKEWGSALYDEIS